MSIVAPASSSHVLKSPEDYDPATTVSTKEEEHPSQIRYTELDAKLLTASSQNISVIKSKNLKLVDFEWTGKGSSIPPAIELVEGLLLKYGWSEDSEMGANKLCLSLSETFGVQQFFEKIETRAIELASLLSEQITGSHYDTETIRSFKWFSNTEQVKLTFDPTKCRIFSLDKDNLLTEMTSVHKIEKGSTIYPVISIKRMWYADQFGIQYQAEAIAVRPPGPKPFDFILDTGKVFPSNRLLFDMDYVKEMDFEQEIYNHPSYGSPMYFFNLRKAEIGRMKAPFGAQVEDVSSGSGTLSLDIDDDKVEAFFSKLDIYITDQVSERFTKWFSMKSKTPMTGERLRQFLYTSTVKASKNDQFAKKLKFKIFIDPKNTRKYTEVFVMQSDGTHIKGTYEDITQKSHVVPQFAIDYLWFKGSKSQITSFGTTLALRRVLVYPGASKSHNITGFHGFSMKRKIEHVHAEAPAAKVMNVGGYSSEYGDAVDAAAEPAKEAHSDEDFKTVKLPSSDTIKQTTTFL